MGVGALWLKIKGILQIGPLRENVYDFLFHWHHFTKNIIT